MKNLTFLDIREYDIISTCYANNYLVLNFWRMNCIYSYGNAFFPILILNSKHLTFHLWIFCNEYDLFRGKCSWKEFCCCIKTVGNSKMTRLMLLNPNFIAIRGTCHQDPPLIDWMFRKFWVCRFYFHVFFGGLNFRPVLVFVKSKSMYLYMQLSNGSTVAHDYSNI